MNAYIKFGQILSVCSQDIELKNFKGHNSVTNLRKMAVTIPTKILSNYECIYIKFGEILSICSQDIEWKQNSDKSRAITLLQMSEK